MKKHLALALFPVLLASCNPQGEQQNNRPYTITVESMGYSVDDEGKITIKQTDVKLFSTAGAPDVRSIDYTAVLLNSKGQPANSDNSTIVPTSGTLFGNGKGGYICTSEANAGQPSCWMGASDVVLVDTGPIQWPVNNIAHFMMPGEWASAHLMSETRDSAGWYAEFTFRAVQTNGKVVTWKQNYQIIAPA